MPSSQDFGLGFLAGFLAAVLVGFITSALLSTRQDEYGLGHWKLNIKTPLRSMWMNVGYWRNEQGEPIEDFPEASAALLREVINTAGFAKGDGGKTAILDLGFGCGDQTWDLVQLMHAEKSGFQYVGLSLDQYQVRAAQRRIHRDVTAHTAMGQETLSAVHLFCADAARPETWNRQISESVESLSDQAFSERWLLALDCIYHFKPSRKPVFQLATSKLHANLMLFDLILNDQASAKDIFFARLVSIIMRCPVKTFMTEPEYRQQLEECGFEPESIVMREITDHVFSGLAGFIQRQDAALAEYSISLGGFKLAQRLFEWFDRSRVVKAVIVVARAKQK
ncbi:hypothetical protein B0I35DRAFT_364932 [Stachybotrys elegans]|uniref:Methyltransferase domain-containing protein n=1 Tax=Stachybotrys elegans TaxID=80388 RepID=A0A8K0WJ24_9HYPO|nr:hypothetical protein B0I35DRAFT_364932 [Stachybotrys elegans]